MMLIKYAPITHTQLPMRYLNIFFSEPRARAREREQNSVKDIFSEVLQNTEAYGDVTRVLSGGCVCGSFFLSFFFFLPTC